MNDLTAVLSKIARTLEPEDDVDTTVAHIVAAAAGTVPGTDEAGVSLLDQGKMRSVAPSSDVVAYLDDWQHRLGEGPCVDAVFERPAYRVDDISTDPRWPRFGAKAAEAGMLSIIGFRLFTDSTTIGALNLYARRANAFDEDAERICELFAAHAAVALAGSKGIEQLQVALRTRDVIGMAKGILMERHGVDADRAFELLVAASQHANVKLRDVASWLVDGSSRRT